LDDLAALLRKWRRKGPFGELLKQIPGMGDVAAGMSVDEGELTRIEAVIYSMTLKERANPQLVDASRRRRIAEGAGANPADVSAVVKMFEPMRAMMEQLSGLTLHQKSQLGWQLSRGMDFRPGSDREF
jgi:signal recognition particle subunit SRP54